jgi:adenosylcobinamide-phosphate synthase
MIIPVAAVTLKLSPLDSLRILLRDGNKHPSPNSGLTEAAVAGALNVQLGGVNYYFGQPSLRPTLGDPVRELRKNDILKINALMFVILILATIIFLAVRFSLHW